ncbi:CoxG family protein [Paraburkholderia dinghuensis]|uniref:Carbon monoxide dehydrogenase n=1 Tax=Paraburkholderia dinghuensis TaxID=2305225 RepID=A0A3N6MHS1_9BURK|nr:carbon monoxide dehydrogenase subunit G [Paraburkholderia dinghuensis]RQH03694.1 carbon monoxide dehydrogenase [Paraburkholderia dinghuensis]
MELTESHSLPVPQQRAWEALNDTAILKACIPGCESIEADGENAWSVALMAAVGPVKARFKGRLALTDVEAPNRYTIHFEGQGGAAGFGKGSAQVLLQSAGDDATTLSYTATAQVGGKLAQIGSRLVDGAAQKIAAHFFKRFGEQLGDSTSVIAEAEQTEEAEAPQTEGDDAAEAPSGDEPNKRRRSWTAWISKS